MKDSDWFWIIVFILLVGGLFANNHRQGQQKPSNVGTQGKLAGPAQVIEDMTVNIEVSHIEPNASYILVYENTSTAFTSKTTTAYIFINPTYPTQTKGLLVIQLYGYNSTTHTTQGPLLDQLSLTIVLVGGLPGNYFINTLPIFVFIIILLIPTIIILAKFFDKDHKDIKRKCSQCKHTIESKDQFCVHCGYKLQENKEL